MGKHSAGPEEPVPTGIAEVTPAGGDQAQPDALWTIRHTVSGRRQTFTTTRLNELLRDDTIRLFDVNAIPLDQAGAA